MFYMKTAYCMVLNTLSEIKGSIMRCFKILTFLLMVSMAASKPCIAGPPFDTDDPVPVLYKHWEYYISSINTYRAGVWSGTLPHLEFNYGVVRNVQIHLLLPLNYMSAMHSRPSFGYADTEFGFKFRFLKETGNRPQAGIFPIIEVPTFRNSEFSDGKTKVYIPLWLQKGWDRFTTYGGAGYWINPGSGNKNWIFAGWEAQYDFSDHLTLGGELFLQSPDTSDGSTSTGFNLGGSVNTSDKFHIIFSLGRNLTGGKNFSSYFGLLWTI